MCISHNDDSTGTELGKKRLIENVFTVKQNQLTSTGVICSDYLNVQSMHKSCQNLPSTLTIVCLHIYKLIYFATHCLKIMKTPRKGNGRYLSEN